MDGMGTSPMNPYGYIKNGGFHYCQIRFQCVFQCVIWLVATQIIFGIFTPKVGEDDSPI